MKIIVTYLKAAYELEPTTPIKCICERLGRCRSRFWIKHVNGTFNSELEPLIALSRFGPYKNRFKAQTCSHCAQAQFYDTF